MKKLTEAERRTLAQDIEKALEKCGVDGWFLLCWDTKEYEGQTYYDGSRDKCCVGEFLMRTLTVAYNMLKLSHNKRPGVRVDGPAAWDLKP